MLPVEFEMRRYLPAVFAAVNSTNRAPGISATYEPDKIVCAIATDSEARSPMD